MSWIIAPIIQRHTTACIFQFFHSVCILNELNNSANYTATHHCLYISIFPFINLIGQYRKAMILKCCHLINKQIRKISVCDIATFLNKANLRDLIAATGLVIFLKLDSNRRFFSPCDLDIWWMTPKNNRAPLQCYFKPFASFRSHWWIQTGVTNGNAQFGSKSTIF